MRGKKIRQHIRQHPPGDPPGMADHPPGVKRSARHPPATEVFAPAMIFGLSWRMADLFLFMGNTERERERGKRVWLRVSL